jgi:hypothetical protein
MELNRFSSQIINFNVPLLRDGITRIINTLPEAGQDSVGSPELKRLAPSAARAGEIRIIRRP